MPKRATHSDRYSEVVVVLHTIADISTQRFTSYSFSDLEQMLRLLSA